MIGDQELAGLDILTNGDYHLDADFAGRSWFSYPLERLGGVSEFDPGDDAELDVPVGHVAQRDHGRLALPGDRGQGRAGDAARVREDLAGRAGRAPSGR